MWCLAMQIINSFPYMFFFLLYVIPAIVVFGEFTALTYSENKVSVSFPV